MATISSIRGPGPLLGSQQSRKREAETPGLKASPVKKQKSSEVPDATEDSVPKVYATFTKFNDNWKVSLDFFTSHEARDLLKKTHELDLVEDGWIIRIKDKEKSLAGTGIVELLGGITKISRPFMSIQRYKGLGEMNADQLWETAMDAKTRSLVKVTIGDELEADLWFDTLMGSDVAGRREFIEENGRFVKNLDI